MSTFALRANALSGQTGLTVRLYASGDDAIANGASGDTLTETVSSDGQFTATVAESLSGLHDYAVYKSGSAVWTGQVYCSGTTWVADTNTPVTIVPASATAQSRVTGTNITLFTAELCSVSVAVVDSDGAAVDLTAMTLELIFESGSTEVVVTDGSITKAVGAFTFTATSALTTNERLWKWALRKTTDETVLVHGRLEVNYAANN